MFLFHFILFFVAWVLWSASAFLVANTGDANVGCSFFRYMNDDLRNHTNQRHGLGKTTNLHYTAILGATLLKEDIEKMR